MHSIHSQAIFRFEVSLLTSPSLQPAIRLPLRRPGACSCRYLLLSRLHHRQPVHVHSSRDVMVHVGEAAPRPPIVRQLPIHRTQQGSQAAVRPGAAHSPASPILARSARPRAVGTFALARAVARGKTLQTTSHDMLKREARDLPCNGGGLRVRKSGGGLRLWG
jgi:hypothetical protein